MEENKLISNDNKFETWLIRVCLRYIALIFGTLSVIQTRYTKKINLFKKVKENKINILKNPDQIKIYVQCKRPIEC